MKKRIITSVVYVVVWILLCVLKWYVPGGWGALGFDAVFCALSVLGCIEFLRAVKGVSFAQKTVALTFCAGIVPLYVVVQMAIGNGVLAVACWAIIYAFFIAALNVFNHGVSTVRGTAVSLLAMLYCGVLSCILSAVNHISENSMAAVLTLFLTAMFTDSGAFIFGSLLGRYVPRKLAPTLSPHKTVIGGVGGLIGGMLGAVVAYFVFIGLANAAGTSLVYGGSIPAAVVFLLIGLVASIFMQIGDLFESAVKRECNIKDMGKLLPGHGGVLDRFDGMLFGGVIVLLAFGLLLI